MPGNATTSEVRKFSLIPQKSYKQTGPPVMQRRVAKSSYIGFDLDLHLHALDI